MSHFVTDGSEAVGIGRDGSGTSAAEKRCGITLFGIGRERLESPSVGSTPGHPKKVVTESEVPQRRVLCRRVSSDRRDANIGMIETFAHQI